jgi:hypothetical protein
MPKVKPAESKARTRSRVHQRPDIDAAVLRAALHKHVDRVSARDLVRVAALARSLTKGTLPQTVALMEAVANHDLALVQYLVAPEVEALPDEIAAIEAAKRRRS